MKGYKVFNSDWTCRDFQYGVGQMFEMGEFPILCDRGFHFCEKAIDCFDYYPYNPENKVAEVEAIGEIVTRGNKSATNKIIIVRELSWEDVQKLVNIGPECTGIGNTGSGNSGDRNTGDYNKGSKNTGNRNTGDMNTGCENSGRCNTGDGNSGSWNSGSGNAGGGNSGEHNYGNLNTGNNNGGNGNAGDGNTGNRNTGGLNSGDRNSGSMNSGNRNTGYRNKGSYNVGENNKGDCNTGHYNSGECNAGSYNAGDYNTGDWNIASHSSGCFGTEEPPMYFFDKPSTMTRSEWRASTPCRIMQTAYGHLLRHVGSYEMTDQEITDNPDAYARDLGYLKETEQPDILQDWWNQLTKSEHEAVMGIPNFDAEKFKLITGIDVSKK